ncbi:MAG TPA: sulfotransferase [Solirubrobacterales bacterium]
MSFATEEQTIVCVLGMSRSGTSLATRVLNLAGVYLGPEEELLDADLRQLADEGERVLAKARYSNPEGHWEHYRLMRLNERILKSLGGNWREPPQMSPGWESSQQLVAEREQAEVLLAESFDGHELWGWKDPRNSLTLPFWQRLLPQMRYVVCLRNPIDVAASLERRDGMPIEQGLELWRTYVLAALAGTDGHPRLFVAYEDFFTKCAGTPARLARFVGREGAFEDEEGRRRLAGVVDERLWRNRTSVSDLAVDSRVSSEVAAVHRLTQRLAAAEAANAR